MRNMNNILPFKKAVIGTEFSGKLINHTAIIMQDDNNQFINVTLYALNISHIILTMIIKESRS